ncbi:MAG: sodium:solute symporter [Verrucomicrobiota bacterium JB022]|nr:sodium:solute symporter [Verrucomicrobiota bacterium JB022]
MPAEQSHVELVDALVLVAYFLMTLGIGFYFWRKSRSVAGFTAGNGSMSGILTGLSILGTYISSISFLALPGKAFATNWNSFVFSLSIPVAAVIAVKWFMPFYRDRGEVSAYSHLEERFGRWARVYTSLCYLLTQVARIATVTYLMALPVSVLLGVDIRLIILVTGITTTVYTFAGGIVGVIWTDAIQTVILILGALVCAGLMIFSLPGGAGQFLEAGLAYDKFSLGSFGPEVGESTFWVVLVYGLVINLQNFGIDQNYVQRYHASRSKAEAAKSIWIGGLIYLPVSALFFLIGTALFVYYATFPENLPAAYREASAADSVFPWFIVTELPAGVRGLLIASIFAAAMSTISSSLNSSSTIVLNDYFALLRDFATSEKAKMRVLYGATVVFGVLGTSLALALVNVPSILDAWWILAGTFGGGSFGLFLLGMLSRTATGRDAILAVLLGVVVILWLTFSTLLEGFPEALRSPFHGFFTIVIGTATILLTGFLSAACLRRG